MKNKTPAFTIPKKITGKIFIDGTGLGERANGKKSYIQNLLSNLSTSSDFDFNLILDENDDYFVNKNDIGILRKKKSNFFLKMFFPSSDPLQNANPLAPQVYHFVSTFSSLPERGKIVTSVQDLYFLKDPRLYPKGYAEKFREIIIESHVIIVSSEFIRDELVQYMPIAAMKEIKIIHQGCDPLFFRKPDIKAELPKKFILVVGEMKKRKNLKNILKGFKSFKLKNKNDSTILLFAGEDSGSITESEINRLNLEDHAFCLGEVSLEELHCLYSKALFLLMPSLYEGFGLPIIEAMASGCPIITSNCTAMPEISGGAAQLVNPTSLKEITEAITLFVKDNKLRAKYRQMGRRVVSKLNWKIISREILQIYKELIDSYENV